MPDQLTGLLAAALEARADLLTRLHAEETDAYRLFHGSVEGLPGLTVDRYGNLGLVQSFHQGLAPEQLAEIEAFYDQAWPGLGVIYNDRSQANSRIRNPLEGEKKVAAHLPRECRELGVHYRIQARHEGQDPWLFLDLRAGRRRVMAEAAGKSVLNLFAYTCGVGIAAAKAGARFVVNVDFAETSLKIGRENARLNALPIRPRFLQSDVFAALRQFSGLGQPEMVRGKRLPPFPKLEAQQFDLVFLDPPRYAKVPVLGVIPQFDVKEMEEAARAALPAHSSALDVENFSKLICLIDPKSPLSESLRSLRTNIQFASMDRKVKSILFTKRGPWGRQKHLCHQSGDYPCPRGATSLARRRRSSETDCPPEVGSRSDPGPG